MLFPLAERPGGRGAAELAEDLFGDPSRTVTVRAEMSRIRRCLGGLLQHRPYRLAEAAEVEVLLPGDPRALLPRSTSPAVERRRAAMAGNRPAPGASAP